jgi:uncharacterized protein (DUF924 family)
MFQHDGDAQRLARIALDGQDALPLAQRAALAVCLSGAEDSTQAHDALRILQALKADPRTRRNRKTCRRLHSMIRGRARAIARFGRDPHRNHLLGRETTPAEAVRAPWSAREILSVYRTQPLRV